MSRAPLFGGFKSDLPDGAGRLGLWLIAGFGLLLRLGGRHHQNGHRQGPAGHFPEYPLGDGAQEMPAYEAVPVSAQDQEFHASGLIQIIDDGPGRVLFPLQQMGAGFHAFFPGPLDRFRQHVLA